ncbi:MAG: GGDEF domain-containing protein [Anaeroplasma sp.]
MYNKNYLSSIPFFLDIDVNDTFDNILDPLTKTISRKYIIKYVTHLIDLQIPFSMGIIDIDNFKHVNDNYGHTIGDLVLSKFAEELITYVDKRGLVGRFGGDEFIVVYLCDGSYPNVYSFYFDLYNNSDVFRKNYAIMDGVNCLITGTVGAASYPLDSLTYDELFEKADKALYRGKSKGRNCFIVYVDKKHKDIDLSKNTKKPLYITLLEVFNQLYNQTSVDCLIERYLEIIKDSLKISDAFFVDKNFKDKNDDLNYKKIDIDAFSDSNGFFYSNDLNKMKCLDENLYLFCKNKNVLSILTCKVAACKKTFGYIVLAESRIERIWQDEDMAIGVVISKLIAMKLNTK